MISDEMRELLSSYVDGELRDADAARVEDASKRDPELRREIEAYRTLRRKLREWDAADQPAAPDPAFIAKTVARARVMDAALSARPRSGLLGPLAIAASLLLAAAAGLLIARSTAPGAPSLPDPPARIVLKELPPVPDLALEGSALAAAESHAPEVVSRMRLYDHIPSRRALELAEAMRREELVRATPPEPEPERRTGTPISLEIKAMVSGYAPAGAPSEALVLISRPPAMKALDPVEPASGHSIDPSGPQIMSKLVGEGPAVLSPLGEVWIGADRRARLIAASSWVRRNSSALLDVVWADEIATSKTHPDVEAQEVVLGPKARQRLLSASRGRDAAFLAWLRESYGDLPARLSDGAKDRERAVNRLVDALEGDATATGFAVFDAKGTLLGTELFRDHAMMLAFAPRLLRGYLLEAGEDAIRVAPSPSADRRLDMVGRFLGGMPERGQRVEREALDVPYDALSKVKAAPDGVARVTLYSASGEAVGHGLVQDETPIHLTLFGG